MLKIILIFCILATSIYNILRNRHNLKLYKKTNMRYLIFILLLLVSCAETNETISSAKVKDIEETNSSVVFTGNRELVEYIVTYKDSIKGEIKSVFAKYNNELFQNPNNSIKEVLFHEVYTVKDSICDKIDIPIKDLLQECLPSVVSNTKGVWLYIFPHSGNVLLNFVWFKEDINDKYVTEKIVSFAERVNEEIKLSKKTNLRDKENCYTQYAIYW